MTNNVEFNQIFRDNFKDYGQYVIEERALPDIRDGLKPVYRKILYTMGKNKITSDKKPIKVAKITGDVIGLYHPHGDKAVEDALANLALPWKHTMPPIHIKGNKGSVFGDPHAAGRYIEAKLTPTGDAYIRNMKPGIVPYESNYDETTTLATVLPAGLPYLLINGDEGIAVGYTSKLPTHNPIEVINAFIAYVKNPKITQDELLTIIPGPDFPTAGEIINKEDLREIYETGKGTIIVRGKVNYDTKTHSLHITEIPFTSSGSMDVLVEKITKATQETLVKKKGKTEIIPPKYPWAIDVQNYSGKDGIDIEVSLKAGVNPDIAIQELYAKTPLEATLTYEFQALNDHKLSQYSMKRYFKEYLAFQHEILINEQNLRLEEINKRMEIISGLLILQTMVDEVVASAKASDGKAQLRDVLMAGLVLEDVPKKYHKKIKTFAFTEKQAEHITNLPLYKINKMDYQELIKEGQQLQKEQKHVESLIESPIKRKNLIIKRHEKELSKLDPNEFARKTRIIQDSKSEAVEFETPLVPVYISMDKYGYVKISEKPLKDGLTSSNKDRILFVAENGMMYPYYLDNYDVTSGRGQLTNQLLSVTERIVGISGLVDKENRQGLFIFKDGNVKVVNMNRYQTKSRARKISKDKSEHELLYYVDIPEHAKNVTINERTFKLSDLSHSNGHGRNEFKNGLETVNIEFDTTDTIEEQNVDGLVIFDGSETVRFDWNSIDPNQYQGLYVVKYSELLTKEILFVHTDGTAKIVDGSQFEVKTKRTSIKGNKPGVTALYIGEVPDTMLATYEDGAQKRIDTKLISHQGKLGGGARAFYSKKHKLIQVEDGKNSKLPLTSLASQPK